MPAYFRILPRKLDDLVAVQVVKQSRVDLPRELIEELVEEFDIDEHGRRIGQFVRHDIQEGFGTERVAFGAGFAPLRFESRETELEDTQSISVQGSMTRWNRQQ
jgi:hypothetical protein